MYRAVNCDTWDDPWFSELDPQAKLLFLYLITNRRSTPCGAFEITPRAMSFETGIPVAEVKQHLVSFAPRVLWWEGHNIVWLRNFYKHQKCNENYRKGAASAAADMPEEVSAAIYETYPDLLPNPSPRSDAPKEPVREPLPNRSKPLPDGIQTGGKEEAEAEAEENQKRREQQSRAEARDAPASADPACSAGLISELRSCGLSEGQALEIVGKVSCEQIRLQLDWWPERKARAAPKVPALYLRSAILENYEVNEAMREMRQAEGEKRRKDAEKAESAGKAQATKAESEERERQIQATWDNLPPEEQAEIDAEAQAEFRQKHSIHAKKLDSGTLGTGSMKLLKSIRDEILLRKMRSD